MNNLNNFDTIYNSFLTLLVISTLDDWNELMTDST